MSFNLTSELARICGELTGDGHIQLKEWRGLISFYSKNFEEIINFKSRFENLFNLKGHIYEDKRNNCNRYKSFFISVQIANYFVSLGVPFGNKTNQPFFVPVWVFSGDKKIKAAYLRGLFAAEGSIYGTKNKAGVRWRIEIELWKWVKYQDCAKKFMLQLVEMLSDLGVVCSPVRFGKKNIRKDKAESIAVKFNIEKTNFRNFYKRVGFTNRLKASKLACLCGE